MAQERAQGQRGGTLFARARAYAPLTPGERALMQPYIAGCGPWRTAGYFADHDLGDPAAE